MLFLCENSQVAGVVVLGVAVLMVNLQVVDSTLVTGFIGLGAPPSDELFPLLWCDLRHALSLHLLDSSVRVLGRTSTNYTICRVNGRDHRNKWCQVLGRLLNNAEFATCALARDSGVNELAAGMGFVLTSDVQACRRMEGYAVHG